MIVHFDTPAWLGPLMWATVAVMAVVSVAALVLLIRDFITWSRQR